MNSQQAAVVTGASTGIGAAVARTLARNGYRVALVARNQEKLERIREEIGNEGGDAEVVALDLRDRAAVADVPNRVKALGSVNVLANIAAVWHGEDRAFYGPLLHETEVEEILDVMEVGIVAPMLLTRALLPLIIAADGGSVINLSGTFSEGGRGWMHYFVSKRALEQFTVGLADEVGELGVKVNCVSPADVATEAYVRFFPEDAATALAPENVAEVVQWLTSDAARHVSGQIIEVRERQAP
ncbi:MAG: SDR family NAD(P)-dependent oxidoreductase [Solirubrobacterales bacterium]